MLKISACKILDAKMGESGSDSRSDSQSDFGVKISIQALKGHPFVILEGNDAKKKYVPAPKQQDFEQTDEQVFTHVFGLLFIRVFSLLMITPMKISTTSCPNLLKQL